MGKKKKREEERGNWHCSLELVEEFWQAGLLVTGSWQQWKLMRIAEKSSWLDRKMDISSHSRSIQTSKLSRDRVSMGASMLSLLDFHAPHSPMLESKKSATKTTYGQKHLELLGKFNPEESSWRMSPDCYGYMEKLSSQTLPLWGLIVNGELYQLEMPMLNTSGNDGGVLPGNQAEESWPTPTSGDSKSSCSRNTSTSKANRGMSLTDAVMGDGGGGRNGLGRQGTLLNPDFVEWLMGWPIGWTSLEPLPKDRMEEWEKGISEGSWWDERLPKPIESRCTNIRAFRTNRLKALGNGQVPAQALLAMRVLFNE